MRWIVFGAVFSPLIASDSLEKRVATLKDPHFFLRSVRFFFLWGRGDHDQYLTMPRHV